MLNLISVHNIVPDELLDRSYDIAVFASGYESRSTFLANHLANIPIKNSLILAFTELSDSKIRKDNDKFYEDKFGPLTLMSSTDEQRLYFELVNIFEVYSAKDVVNVLIDYTSMSRLWYAGLLNFFRFQKNPEINIYLNYSLGLYGDDFLDYSYSSINSLPSHEGSLSSNNKTILVLAVGFSPYLVKSVIEEIEPSEIVGILALPNLKPEYEAKSIKIKDDILTKDIDNWVNCPINDLESIFRAYTEITSNTINEKDIMFLSLGPKIFTIASILVSQRFEQVTCLYLKNSRKEVFDVKPTGNFITNKIVYRP